MPSAPDGLVSRLVAFPVSADEPDSCPLLADIRQAKLNQQDLAILAVPQVGKLVAGISAGSPYLSGLIRQSPERFINLLRCDPELRLTTLIDELGQNSLSAETMAELMVELRNFKSEAALLIALCDLGGIWPIMTVTDALTRVADAATAQAVSFLFREAQRKGDWQDPNPSDPAKTSGYIVLAMGKHGAFELNYSSDIDLIVFYDPAKSRLADPTEAQGFFVKLTRNLVKCMNEQTRDGYVFRTDLRLRPDPGATQVAISVDSALHYYESFGQNWERAAMIKARPIAGDIEAGLSLLGELSAFVWRKYLDYAAIADVHAMKRQIHVHRGFGEIAVAGHNIKVGRGGIREIEFFVQTQQLIAGGRQPELRTPRTLEALDLLVERGWIEAGTRNDLEEAYRFLRWLEHRIQMTADQQTHQLPSDDAQLLQLARFSGFAEISEMEAAVRARLEIVQQHYSALFEDIPQLSSDRANLVFTGEDDDPDTVAALQQMGYNRPNQVIASIRSWHRGRFAAVRSEKSRERLTDVQPVLIEALADTVDPDAALVGFERFLAQLPAGIQLFALLKANPDLMRLLANIVGSAPRLADILSKRSRVFDAVLDPRIIGNVASNDEISEILTEAFDKAASYEEVLDIAREIGGEQSFLVGVRILSGVIDAERAGDTYALLAEELVRRLQTAVEEDFSARHGHVDDGRVAVLAMGKLGGREMTAASDLDLITVYDFDPNCQASDGERQLAPSQYYARFTQRLISALSSPTSKGQLYEVDLRLRPSGQMGPVATRLASFVDYQREQAWTWEHMALTRARVISGPPQLRHQIEDAIRASLVVARDRDKVTADVLEMRERIEKEKGTENIWDLKQVRGGLVDIEFVSQYLQLLCADADPEVLDQNTFQALQRLRLAGHIDGGHAEQLQSSLRLIQAMEQITRLCFAGPFDPETAPGGLKDLLTKIGGEVTFDRLEDRLRQDLIQNQTIFHKIIK
ncbi:MAG: bifunctional [glutamine synthetase] adenylyltransferase/[glutamine synthetase]-adenylyl-L-tyrosine phosphorylase [Pseudomonadota bacterium]